MNNEKVLISVIIPSYNRSNTVGMTIESIVSQNGVGEKYELEIIVGDDCSTDDARVVLERYQQQYPDIIRLFFREKNVGLGANWAMCVKDCQGKYICNCDNDDYWHNPNKLLLQLDYMESHPNSNVLITDHRCHNRDTGVITEEKCKFNISNPDPQNEIWNNGSWCNATIMYRAAFMKAHLDLDQFIERHLSLQDWPTWVILAAYTHFDVLPISTATFGVETVSITRPDSVEGLANRYEKDKGVCQYLGELFPEKYPFNEIAWEKYVNRRLAIKALHLGDFESAKKYSKYSVGLRKWQHICCNCIVAFKLYQMIKKKR